MKRRGGSLCHSSFRLCHSYALTSCLVPPFLLLSENSLPLPPFFVLSPIVRGYFWTLDVELRLLTDVYLSIRNETRLLSLARFAREIYALRRFISRLTQVFTLLRTTISCSKKMRPPSFQSLVLFEGDNRRIISSSGKSKEKRKEKIVPGKIPPAKNSTSHLPRRSHREM